MMHYPAILAVAGALAIGAPGGDPSNDDDLLTDAEAFATAAGTVLGAASACDEIAEDRLSAISEKVALVIVSTVKDRSELASSQQLLTRSAGAGRGAVRRGQTDCESVELSLARLERVGDQLAPDSEQNEDSGSSGQGPETRSGSPGPVRPPPRTRRGIFGPPPGAAGRQ